MASGGYRIAVNVSENIDSGGHRIFANAGWNVDASEIELLQTPVGTLMLIVEWVSSDENVDQGRMASSFCAPSSSCCST
jgi:hypothetical protein